MLRSFDYVRARSIEEAARLSAEPGSRVHAGGTDLVGCLRDGIIDVRRVISLARVEAMRGISSVPSGGVRIGAMTTLAELAGHAVVKTKFPVLAQAAQLVASPQLRNQGTIGGNLCQRPRCWYFRADYACTRKGGDTCYAMDGENQYHAVLGGSSCWIVHPSDCAAAFVALDATFRIEGPKGARTIPAGSFFVLPEDEVLRENVLEPGELLVEIELPPPAAGQTSTYRKVRGRGAWDFAIVGLAAVIAMKSDRKVTAARLVLSGVAPKPWRATDAEKLLIGQRLDPKLAAKVADAALADAKPLAQNAYKIDAAKGVITEVLGKL